MELKGKKLLILGSDYATIDIVKAAHELGVYVITADLMESSPTKQASDEAWLISTTEIDLLAQKCIEEQVDGVLTGASDFNITQSRKLCKRLNFPLYCESDEAWNVATNKRAFKDLCKKVGAPVAEDYILSDALSEEEIAQVRFPVVVKPVDKSGNNGMSYCHNREELIDAYRYARSVSANATIIVERELRGPEFAVNYVLADGEIQLYFFSSEHNEPGELENLYSLITTTSCHLKQYLSEVNDKVIEVFTQAGCRDGVAWVETILDKDGRFYLLEMGYRFGGEVVNVPYKYVSGFDSMKFMVEYALGVKHTAESLPARQEIPQKKCAATYLLFATHDGVICSLEGLKDVESLENVLIDMPKRKGEKVRYHSTMGCIHIFADDMSGVCQTLQTINSKLCVRDENGKDMFIYFTDYESVVEEYEAGLQEFLHC